jgi:hypothetical protein
MLMIVNVGSVLFANKNHYLTTDYWERYPNLKKIYYNSVYANKNGSWVPDEVLYAFNGGALLKGVSPILVNPEVPPTGKYIISLSIFLFNNENELVPVAACLVLIMMFLLGRQAFKNQLLALFPPALFSTDPMLKNQLIYTPLLDIFHLLFLLCTLYFFNKGILSKQKSFVYFLLSNVFLGLFISTKFFAVGITVVLASLVVLLLHKEFKKMMYLILSYPVAVFILLFSYVRVLIIGYPFLKFLGIQKWVFWYNKGHLHEPFSFWPLIMFGSWHQAGGKVVQELEWRVWWPISVILWFAGLVIVVWQRLKSQRAIEVLLAWSFFYMLMMTFVDANARYLILLMPVLYIVGFWFIEQIVLITNTRIIKK